MEDFFNKKFFKIFDLPAFSDEYKETLDRFREIKRGFSYDPFYLFSFSVNIFDERIDFVPEICPQIVWRMIALGKRIGEKIRCENVAFLGITGHYIKLVKVNADPNLFNIDWNEVFRAPWPEFTESSLFIAKKMYETSPEFYVCEKLSEGFIPFGYSMN